MVAFTDNGHHAAIHGDCLSDIVFELGDFSDDFKLAHRMNFLDEIGLGLRLCTDLDHTLVNLLYRITVSEIVSPDDLGQNRTNKKT